MRYHNSQQNTGQSSARADLYAERVANAESGTPLNCAITRAFLAGAGELPWDQPVNTVFHAAARQMLGEIRNLLRDAHPQDIRWLSQQLTAIADKLDEQGGLFDPSAGM